MGKNKGGGGRFQLCGVECVKQCAIAGIGYQVGIWGGGTGGADLLGCARPGGPERKKTRPHGPGCCWVLLTTWLDLLRTLPLALQTRVRCPRRGSRAQRVACRGRYTWLLRS
jgi:hypothetical protein